MIANGHSVTALRQTVSRICGLIGERSPARNPGALSESELRFELVSCLLGSQVRAESANAAAEQLRSASLLSDNRWKTTRAGYENDVRAVLRESSYRFPALRARQIAALRDRTRLRPLRACLSSFDDARAMRQELVRDLPGIGPKQASMFLRNVGASYDLAILDVHVLRFLQIVDVLQSAVQVSRLAPYEQAEAKARTFAQSLGRTVGHLDWAIWITMRAAREVHA